MEIFANLLKNSHKDFFLQNRISDLQFSITYSEFLKSIEILDNIFASNDYFYFNCSNTLLHAIALLWLIVNKKSFVLVPPVFNGSKSIKSKKDIPKFCRYIIEIKQMRTSFKINAIGDNFQLVKNPYYQNNDKMKQKICFQTSGSISNPKLVMYSYENLVNNSLNCVYHYSISEVDKILIPIPIFHMFGFGAALLPGFLAGSSIALVPNTNILRYLHMERKFKPNIVFLTPGLCEMLLKTVKGKKNYRLAIVSGDRSNSEKLERFEKQFGLVINQYGSTEMGAIASSGLKSSLVDRVNGLLEPFPEVKIEYRHKLKDLPLEKDIAEKDTAWEIICRHPYAFDSYINFNGQELETELKVIDNWFLTGDSGKIYRDKDLKFKVLGRIDNAINRNGLLISLSEIENIIENSIAEVEKIIILKDDKENIRGKRIIGFCILNKKSLLSEKEIDDLCSKLLPHYAVPDKIYILDEFPMLESGKIDRKTLAKLII